MPKLKEQPVDVYQKITDRILAQLEQGCIPWLKPWENIGSDYVSDHFKAARLPENGETGRKYSGLNVFILWLTASEKGYVSNKWVTFQAAQRMGGSVKKGEHSTTVFFRKKVSYVRGQNEEGEDEMQDYLLAREFKVFNIEQTTLLEKFPDKFGEETEAIPLVETNKRDDRIEAWFAKAESGMGIQVHHGGNRAFYSSTGDYVQLPTLAQFTKKNGVDSCSNYYATRAHEDGHATGHITRMKRTFGRMFGDHNYAVEELTAEFISAFVCAQIGVVGALRHAGYIKSWINGMKAHKKFLFYAASNARAATEYLMKLAGEQPVEESELEEAA